jgi:lipopolysaccharide exporter
MHAANRQYWVKSGSYTLLTNIQTLLFGFGAFYLLVRILDKHLFGIWTLFVVTTTILEMARSGLIQNALIKYLSHGSDKEKHDIISASFFLNGILILNGILMIVCIIINVAMAGYLAALWHYSGLVTMFYTYNIVYLLQGVLSQFQWIEQANFSFRGIFLSNTIKQGGFFFYVLWCFVFQRNTSLMNLIYVQAICAVTAATAEYFFIRKYFFVTLKINMSWVKKLFNYGKFAFGTSISSILANTINQMMLGALLSPEAAGVFNVAARISNLADIPSIALSTIVFPQSAKRFAAQGHQAIKYLYEKSVGTILAVLIPFLLILILFPGITVHIVAGHNYNESIPVVKIIALACLFNPFGLLFGTILDSIGKPKVNFIILLSFTILKLGLNFIMIKQYGIMGAVYATLIADAIVFVAQIIILRKELGVNVLNTFVYAARFYPDFFSDYKGYFKQPSQ